jgi:predicted nucleic acid-binding protein
MMIAGHAVAADAILISRDKAFGSVSEPLRTDTWAAD